MDQIYSVHLDANESIFFSRELEYIKAKVYEVVYPTLKAKQVIPVSTDIPAGAETHTYTIIDFVGMAKIIANYADDLPNVGVTGKQYTANIKGIGASYQFSVQDIRAAQMANKPLSALLAKAARQADEMKVDDIAWFGDEEYGLQGFVYNPNISSYVAALNGGTTSTAWAAKTSAEILADFSTALVFVKTVTNGVEFFDTVLIPDAQMEILRTKPLGAGDGTLTVLKFLKENYPELRFEAVSKLSNLSPAVVGGGTTSNVMIFFQADEDKIAFEIPLAFMQHAPQEVNLVQKINCESRCGGVTIRSPLSVLVVEGI